MVWETLKPKYSPYSAISFFITVDLPDPLGPHSTSGLGGARGGLDLGWRRYSLIDTNWWIIKRT